jgi:hypothetical protein
VLEASYLTVTMLTIHAVTVSGIAATFSAVTAFGQPCDVGAEGAIACRDNAQDVQDWARCYRPCLQTCAPQ